MRLCAQCGDQIVPDEAANAPGVSRCAECGAYRLPAQQMTAAPPTPDPQGPPPGVEEGEAYVRVERVGPFVFRQYGRSYRTNGGPG